MATKFPKPIHMSDDISKVRDGRYQDLIRSSQWGAAIRCAVIILELAGVLIWGSSALLMDALSSIFDVASTLLLLLFFKLAKKPPDSNHPFGHGRLEPLGGLLLGVFLLSIGAISVINHALSLTIESHNEIIHFYLWLIPFFAVVLLEISYQVVIYSAKKNHSPALLADAYHYRIDALTSLFAAIALLLAAYIPDYAPLFDHIGALAISIVMIIIGAYSSKENLDQLIDRKPNKEYFALVRKAALEVYGVKDTEKIRIQLSGPAAHVDIDIEVDPTMEVAKAHKISQRVRANIIEQWPAVLDVTVHIEPYYPNDH